MQKSQKYVDIERAIAIKSAFLSEYADAKTELVYRNEYELLIAVMLSAQCTDKRVNTVTPVLFDKYPTVQHLSVADLDDVRACISSVSFFNSKAKHLISMAKSVVTRFNGCIPMSRSELMSLSGVGQKSANVVLSEFLGMNYIAVDTHVFRVSHRLGLSEDKSAIQTEVTLSALFVDDLHLLHQAFVLFGRYKCKALKPLCDNCFVSKFCISKMNFKPS